MLTLHGEMRLPKLVMPGRRWRVRMQSTQWCCAWCVDVQRQVSRAVLAIATVQRREQQIVQLLGVRWSCRKHGGGVASCMGQVMAVHACGCSAQSKWACCAGMIAHVGGSIAGFGMKAGIAWRGRMGLGLAVVRAGAWPV